MRDCWFCERGQTQLCDRSAILGAGTFGGDLPGTQAERVRVPWADINLLSIADGVDDDHALFVGDILTTAVYATSLAAPDEHDVVAVVGLGPVGLLCVQTLRTAGASTVLALDREPSTPRHGLRGRGVAHSISGSAPAVGGRRDDRGRGADIVLDAVGHPDAYRSAISIVRRGGRVVVVGMYAGETVDLQLGVYWARALHVRFAGLSGSCFVGADDGAGCQGAIDPTPLISHRMSLGGRTGSL